jgi:hypothetical protein
MHPCRNCIFHFPYKILRNRLAQNSKPVLKRPEIKNGSSPAPGTGAARQCQCASGVLVYQFVTNVWRYSAA